MRNALPSEVESYWTFLEYNDAIYNKLMDVSDVDDLPLKIRVALVLEGEYILGPNNHPQRRSKTNGCTLILKRNVGVRAKHLLHQKH
jgi:hypothetical protein